METNGSELTKSSSKEYLDLTELSDIIANLLNENYKWIR